MYLATCITEEHVLSCFTKILWIYVFNVTLIMENELLSLIDFQLLIYHYQEKTLVVWYFKYKDAQSCMYETTLNKLMPNTYIFFTIK